jgi:ribosome maturation protein SDO1
MLRWPQWHAPHARAPVALLCSEKDIDEVLQTDRVFVNVSQGEFAKKADLVKAFGTDDEATICLRILKEGEMQVSEKERAKQSEELFHEIATIVVEKCVDANTNRALTVAMVERAMKQLEAAEQFRVLPNKNAKQQALKVIPELAVRFPITRAKMLIRVTVTPGHIDATKPELLAHFAQVMNEIAPHAEAAPYIVVRRVPPLPPPPPPPCSSSLSCPSPGAAPARTA